MSGLAHQEALKRSKYWHELLDFTAADAARVMTTRKKSCSVPRATQVLNDMAQDGMLTRTAEGKWVRASDNRKWLCMRWRN